MATSIAYVRQTLQKMFGALKRDADRMTVNIAGKNYVCMARIKPYSFNYSKIPYFNSYAEAGHFVANFFNSSKRRPPAGYLPNSLTKNVFLEVPVAFIGNAGEKLTWFINSEFNPNRKDGFVQLSKEYLDSRSAWKVSEGYKVINNAGALFFDLNINGKKCIIINNPDLFKVDLFIGTLDGFIGYRAQIRQLELSCQAYAKSLQKMQNNIIEVKNNKKLEAQVNKLMPGIINQMQGHVTNEVEWLRSQGIAVTVVESKNKPSVGLVWYAWVIIAAIVGTTVLAATWIVMKELVDSKKASLDALNSDFDGWKQIAMNPNSTPEQKQHAQAQMDKITTVKNESVKDADKTLDKTASGGVLDKVENILLLFGAIYIGGKFLGNNNSK